jgi:hypothetical protein
MKYCPSCGAEYRDEMTACEDCGNVALLGADEARRRGIGPFAPREDRRLFLRAATAEDPLSADRMTRVLEAAGIAVQCRERGGGSVDLLTSPNHPWWELWVPDELLEQAESILAAERARDESLAPEAARAAEEEEAETEGRST